MDIVDITFIKAGGLYNFSHLLYALVPKSFLVKAATFFSAIIVSVIIVIIFYLFRKSGLHSRKVLFQNRFNDFISEIAICETEEELNQVLSQPSYQEILQLYQRSRVDRNFMIEELAETCKKFSGNTMANINWLFKKTNLKEALLHNLNDKRWYIKAKAIQQLAYLQQKDQLPNIFRLANHNNDLVRMEAQVATVKFIGFDGLRFLNVIGYPISEWQQLRLIQELSQHSIEKFDSVDNWLKSENESVVAFALRLTVIYQLYEFYDRAVECLSHSSLYICKLAVIALAKISNEKTPSLFVNYYSDRDPLIQLIILTKLQAMGTEKELPFLLSQLNHTDDSFKLEAAKAIRQISTVGIEQIEEHIDEAAQPWNIILPQIKMEIAV